jgi:serine/threonine protein kinase
VVDEVLGSSSPRALQSTDIIAGYRLESVIGRGGMGVVYRATQLDLDRTVAIKVIANERAADPEFRARFKLESKLAASIDHPNVMPIFQAGEDNGLLFITMRLVGGTDLEALLARDGALAPARTLRIVRQLASALDAAHANGLVHRDVKPANALLTLDGTDHVYLTDFGVATTIDGEDGLTMAGRWVGTLDYLAPEQIRGDEATPSVDIYALAGLIAHCLTGQIPFARENDAAKLWAHVNALPPAPSQLRPDLPEAIDAVVARGMAKDPAERFKTAGELADACAASLGIASAAASVEEVFEPPAAPSESTTPTVISAQEPKSRSEITPN